MPVTRIVKLADGEELISFESGERAISTVLEDPRRGALERREASDRALERQTNRLRFDQ